MEYIQELSDTLDALRSIPTILTVLAVAVIIIGIVIGVMGGMVIAHLAAIREQLNKTPPSPPNAFTQGFPTPPPYGPNNPYGRP